MKNLSLIISVLTLGVFVTLPAAAQQGPTMMETKGPMTAPAQPGADGPSAPPVEPKGSHMASKSRAAMVKIAPTGPEYPVEGWVKFIEHPEGVKVMGYISGLKEAGKHGIHVHEGSSCGNGGKAAGGHFNPYNTDHGYHPKDGKEGAHLGDMGNVEIDKYGTGSFMLLLKGVEIDGPMGIAGRAVILHEQEDDFGQPTGNAGARIGCGIISGGSTPKGSMKGEMKGSH